MAQQDAGYDKSDYSDAPHTSCIRIGMNKNGLAWTKIWTNMQIYVIEKYADKCRYMQFRNMYKYAKICIYMHIYKYAIYASWKYAIICNYMQKDKYA